MKKETALKILAPKFWRLNKDSYNLRNRKDCEEQRTVAPLAQWRYYNRQILLNTTRMSTVEKVNKQDLKLNSYNVSTVLPCATRVAYLDSPKDLTSERTGSFLGKS